MIVLSGCSSEPQLVEIIEEGGAPLWQMPDVEGALPTVVGTIYPGNACYEHDRKMIQSNPMFEPLEMGFQECYEVAGWVYVEFYIPVWEVE